MASNTYIPKLVVSSFAGTPLTGFADGNFITAERNSDGITLKVGADGESAVAVSADESGKVTITVLNTSKTNDYLSLCANLHTRGPLQIKDLSGRLLVNAEDAWVVKQAAITKSKEVEDNAWVIETGNLAIVNGGNA